MNCKPGDLAYITHPSMLGKLVTVLYAAPDGPFRFPNNTLQSGAEWRLAGDWVIQSMGAPFNVQKGSGPATNIYAVCNDRWLRPIRGDGLEDEAPRVADKPQPVEA